MYKLFLVPLCLAIMILFIHYEHEEKYVFAVVLKGLASSCFVILGILCAIQSINMEFTKMVKYGLLLGLIADIMLNLRFVFKTKGKLVFLVGILVFLAGHVMYLCALIPSYDYLLITIALGIIASALILKWIFSKIEAEKAFKIFGIFYIGVIVIMNAVAIRNFILASTIGNGIFLLGAISFLFSDIVLILNTFGKETKFSLRITNLSLYYVGQLLIAYSLLMF